jgi:ketosteroid isomerase-like protein
MSFALDSTELHLTLAEPFPARRTRLLSQQARAEESFMTFSETLNEHLRAIRDRDLPALIDTLPGEEEGMLLIMSDGQLVRTVGEFIELHRGWFASPTWTLIAQPVQTIEAPELGIAVLHLEYRDTPAHGPSIRETSILTLVFARRDGRWVMVQDQNTPVKTPRR